MTNRFVSTTALGCSDLLASLIPFFADLLDYCRDVSQDFIGVLVRIAFPDAVNRRPRLLDLLLDDLKLFGADDHGKGPSPLLDDHRLSVVVDLTQEIGKIGPCFPCGHPSCCHTLHIPSSKDYTRSVHSVNLERVGPNEFEPWVA